MTYAKDTEVPVERSRAEIERTLTRYGATHFAYMTEPKRAVIAFVADDRRIRFDLPLPQTSDFSRSESGRYTLTEPQRAAKVEQASRERWRAMLLCIKAKLESVESGIETFEQAFYAHVVLPNGDTLYESTRERLAQTLATGSNQPLLPPPSQFKESRP